MPSSSRLPEQHPVPSGSLGPSPTTHPTQSTFATVRMSTNRALVTFSPKTGGRSLEGRARYPAALQ